MLHQGFPSLLEPAILRMFESNLHRLSPVAFEGMQGLVYGVEAFLVQVGVIAQEVFQHTGLHP